MPTRQGTSYNNMANSDETPPTTLTQQMAELINLVKNMGDRLEVLEQGQPQRVQALIPNEPEIGRASCRERV